MAARNHKRTFLFNLSAHEEQNPARRIAWCDRVPTTEKTSDLLVEEYRRNARAAFLTVMDGLRRHPHLAVPCSTWLSNRLTSDARPKGDNYFATPPATLKLIDTDWCVGFIVKHNHITVRTLEAAAVFDPDAPCQLLCFVVRCSAWMKLPEYLVDKELLSLAMLGLMRVGGDRLRGLTDLKLMTGGGGGINWMEVGCYTFDFNENGFATVVRHRPTGASCPVPARSPIHQSSKLSKNWSDYEVVVSEIPTSLLLRSFFGEADGPHRAKVVTGSSAMLSDAIARAKQTQADLQKHQATRSLAGKFNEEHKLKQQRANMNKARTALEAKKGDLERKRTLALSEATPAVRE